MRPRRIVTATGNAGKGREMAAILAETGLEILTLADFPGADSDVEEHGASFAENAEIKARAASKATGEVCIADDGGLVIDALGGAPGLHSKRFLGAETTFPQKMQRILEMMDGIPEEKRTCRFRCAIAIATPEGTVYHCEGTCEGRIANEMKGEFGFGYDPIVFIPEAGRQMAELPPEEKHKISHRGRAMVCAKRVLGDLFPPA